MLRRWQAGIARLLPNDDTVLTVLSPEEQPVRCAAALVGLGLVLERRHEFDAARRHYENALAVYRRISDRTNEAVVLFNLGALHDQQRQLPEALDCFQQSLSICQEIGDRMGEVHAESALASIFLAGQQRALARPMLERAATAAAEIGYCKAEINSLHDLALIDRDEGALDKSADGLRQAQRLDQQFGDPLEVYKVAFDLGDVLMMAERFVEAAESYKDAADAVDSLRSGLYSENEALEVFDEANLEVYDRIVRLHATLLNSPSDALNWSERSRSREFLRRLRWGQLRPPNNIDPALLAREEQLLAQARRAMDRWSVVGAADRWDRFQELESAERALGSVWDQLRTAAPEYVAMRRGDACSWDALVDGLRST